MTSLDLRPATAVARGVPRRVAVVAAMPRNASEKLYRFVILDSVTS